MDAVTLARWQFGIITVYHFFFVPLTLGLVTLVAVMQTMHYRTGDEIYQKMTKFWGKLFLINFAIGVATGIVQEFQFGLNWSEYARFVGDIFGAPLAIEALMAFFLESVFLGLWVFGQDKLSKGVHLAAIWLVAIGSNLSALWILIANSFMQHPVGYVLRNGRAEMTDFFALITNPNIFFQFPHVIFSGLTTGAFFVLGISSYHLLRRGDNMELFRRSFNIGIVAAIIGTLAVGLFGDAQGKQLITSQPMKMAAAEALWETEDPAGLALFALIDETNKRNSLEIEIPYMLSFMSYSKFSGEVKGMLPLQAEYEKKYGPGNYIPPVTISFWTFRTMVGIGTLLIGLALLGAFLVWRGQLEQTPLYLKGMMGAAVLPYIANSSGWLLTELGRQPWIVFGLQKTSDAVSPNVTANMILMSLIGFTVLYGALMVADLYLLVKFAKQGPDSA